MQHAFLRAMYVCNGTVLYCPVGYCLTLNPELSDPIGLESSESLNSKPFPKPCRASLVWYDASTKEEL